MKKSIWIFFIICAASFGKPLCGMQNFLNTALNLVTTSNLKDFVKGFKGHKCPGPWNKNTVENFLKDNNFQAIGEYFYHYTDNDTFNWNCFDTIKEFAERGYPIGMYHYIRNIGLRQGSSKQMLKCLKYVLISYILSLVDYQVCCKIYAHNESTKGAKAFEIFMDKYFYFLSTHKTIANLDNDKTGSFTLQTILNTMVIPWFKKFFPNLNLEKDVDKNNLKQEVNVITENNNDNLLDESFGELPSACWVRVIEKDTGMVGMGNTVIFGVIDGDNSDYCKKNNELIMNLRSQFIESFVVTLKQKVKWQHIFEYQIASEKK